MQVVMQPKLSEKLRLSSSKVKCFLDCRMRFNWEYNEKLTPKKKSKPLMVGDVVHRLLHLYHIGMLTVAQINALDEEIKKLYPNATPEELDEVISDSSRLAGGYVARWNAEPLNTVSSEVWFEHETDDYILQARIDQLARINNELWRVEHKTSSKMDNAYLNGLKNSLQAGIYDHLTSKLMEEKVRGTLYNILVKTKVPQFSRVPILFNQATEERAIAAVEYIAKEINSGCALYPSCNCFNYNSVCPFKVLCDHDSPQVRDAFFETRTSPFEDKKSEEEVVL